MRMSGWFLVDGDAVVWEHVHEHAGATRPYAEIERAYAALEVPSR